MELCRELIRIDTSNYGDEDDPGSKAAEYVATLLDEVGIARLCRARSRARTSLVALGRGRPARTRPAPPRPPRRRAAAAEDWQVDPFSGEIQDGFVWGAAPST